MGKIDNLLEFDGHRGPIGPVPTLLAGYDATRVVRRLRCEQREAPRVELASRERDLEDDRNEELAQVTPPLPQSLSRVHRG
jgi:hypothetical protein